MCDDQDVLAAFQLHYDRLKSNDNIAIRLSPKVAVVVLVFIALCKVLRVLLLNLSVGQAIAYTRIELVERFPFEFLEFEESCGLDCPFQCGCPDCKLAPIANRFGYETG